MDNRSKKFDFPNEILIKILLYLPTESLFRVMCVCRQWFKLIAADNFWKLVALREDWCLAFAEKEVPAVRWIDRFRKISSDVRLQVNACYGDYFASRPDLVWFRDDETLFLTPRQDSKNSRRNMDSMKNDFFFLLPKSGTLSALVDHLLYHRPVRKCAHHIHQTFICKSCLIFFLIFLRGNRRRFPTSHALWNKVPILPVLRSTLFGYFLRYIQSICGSVQIIARAP